MLLSGLLYYCISELAGIQMLIFTMFVRMCITDVELVVWALLPKFYSGDLHSQTWHVFSSCNRRCMFTAHLRIMVEAFLK